ncbi:MAG TPA: hypothetical protein EYQ00_13680 [Dehalococcoidia bacterium]|jgi:hypothetical protein|nr:hypothetical protein [Dehalococcoidia bacterium]
MTDIEINYDGPRLDIELDLRESASDVLTTITAMPAKSYALPKDSLLKGLDLRFQNLQLLVQSHPIELN